MTGYEWFNRAEGLNAVTTVLIASVIVVFVLTAIILGYFIFYKRRINKALKSDGAVKVPSITPGGTAATVMVIVWVSSTILMFLMLTTISIHAKNTDIRGLGTFDLVETMYNNHRYELEWLIELMDKVDSQNITNDYKMKLGEYHSEDNTVALKVKLLPRLTIGSKDKLTFAVGNSVSELKKGKDMYYTGEVRIPTYASYTTGILKLETNGNVLTQIIEEEEITFNSELGYEWVDYYPCVDSSIDGNEEDGVLTTDLSVITYAAEADSTKVFTELSAVFETDSKTIKTVDLMNDSSVVKYGNTYNYKFSEKVDDDGKAVIIRVVGKDNLGYTYDMRIWCIKEGEYIKNIEYAEPGDEVFNVYDPDGVKIIHSNAYPVNYMD